MLLAGLDTTTAALTFAVYCLALHPDKAAKLVAEIDSHPDAYPSYASMQESFPYTDAVLRETLRMFPPGTMLVRVASKTAKLAGDSSQPPCLCMQLQSSAAHATAHCLSLPPGARPKSSLL